MLTNLISVQELVISLRNYDIWHDLYMRKTFNGNCSYNEWCFELINNYVDFLMLPLDKENLLKYFKDYSVKSNGNLYVNDNFIFDGTDYGYKSLEHLIGYDRICNELSEDGLKQIGLL